jgi:hypothetical protein
VSDPHVALQSEDLEGTLLFQDAVSSQDEAPSQDALTAAITELRRRCAAANLALSDVTEPSGELSALRVGMKCGRDLRSLYIRPNKSLVQLLSINFEKYVFLSDFDAICSYSDDIIEAAIRPLSFGPRDLSTFTIEPPQTGFPQIEVSRASDVFSTLVRSPTAWSSRRLWTLKIAGGGVSSHDQALSHLKKTADAVFFQVDLLSDAPFSLVRQRRRRPLRRPRREPNLASDLQYPRTEFDGPPISLYWYGRSASGMPLLQFLAFYQVIEFYFPIYSRAEAQRKLKAILKSPTFRGDRDADINQLLSAIHVSRSGAYGDELSQLRATIMECIDSASLREFLSSDPERLEFYTGKTKTSYHKIPIADTPSADLRDHVARRIYDIRCRIVHTKIDPRDPDVQLLLPFSREAEQLSFDIELVQYLAQQVLIAAGSPLQLSRS